MPAFRPSGYSGDLERRTYPGDLLVGGESPNAAVGAITTVGAGVWTAAAIASGFITRTGPAGGYTDTTDTAQNILAALAGNNNIADLVPGSTFRFLFVNKVAQAMTLAAGRGVTLGAGLSGVVNVAASLVREYIMTVLSNTPEVTLNATFLAAGPAVTFVLPPNMLAFPMGGADNPQGITLTPGMIVTDNTTGGNITAGTTILGITQGQGGITGVTLSANPAGNSAAAGDSLTFSPNIRIDGLRSATA